ncbi:MAG: PhzF family phenazine biosynthesis protein [Pseudonocardiales bacterium]|nr:PhzF family phenazine biosynthesis protein [Pseudonocardiales bacterium]
MSFDVVDVFADRPFAGNPLAVVHGAGSLSTGQLQTLAREFNLSETVFPLAASQPGADYRARIFSAEVEIAQGAELGRPSRLNLQVEASGGRAVRTSVGGQVVSVSAGTIRIP